MIEIRKKINSPLNLIVIFAGIPVLGLYVVRFLKEDLQYILIIFVIGYTLSVTLLTFIIFIFKTEVLYGPGDFKDEKNFILSLKMSKYKVLNKVGILTDRTIK